MDSPPYLISIFQYQRSMNACELFMFKIELVKVYLKSDNNFE